MKTKALVVFASFFAMNAIAGLAYAGPPSHTPGYVSAGTNYLYGTINVRHTSRNDQTNAYIGGYHYANSSVTFYGRDGAGDYFSCYVPTSSALYAQAVDIQNNLTNGAYLYVREPSNSNQCSSVFLRKASNFLD